MSESHEENPQADLAEEGVGVEDLDVAQADAEAVSGGVETTHNIGSQSSGAGAGKITFNPF